MKQKLHSIYCPWRRIAVTVVVVFLSFWNRFRRSNARSRAHWIGNHRRPLRLERSSIALLFLLAMLLLEPREYAVWSAIFGGFTAMVFPLLFFHYQLICLLNEDEH